MKTVITSYSIHYTKLYEPVIGTIGGLGSYFALILKTTFAIIGIGAYAAIFWEVPTKTVALIATLFFMVLNLVGSKKTSAFQKVFVRNNFV